ncbi:osmoprotectant transport system permease protein [Microbacterium phyllosphaerae]|uniref:Osmoprotectant transport system permease protein n=1 Tax=Microbacterium phyllosphaerae TaxID=124798 RepID=A0ABS4WUQ4_9MICO|nr:ABC transporter permease [Microbacterium phyllosphaerae]MBP2379878.1 osmoprotectant transport system permease protein [Microbacterium phyllosphaerae]
MSLLADTIAWFGDPDHWVGPSGIPVRVLQHLALTLAVTAIAVLIALPIGSWIGHMRRGELSIAAITNGARALPTLGLVTVFALWLGIGLQAPLIALVILAVPSILAATYSSIASIPRETIDAARAMGHTRMQTLMRVELPIALPVIGGGVQSALLQVVATATIAAYVADVGLGRYIFAGLKSRDYPEMAAGSLLVILLALLVPALSALVSRLFIRSSRQGVQQ